jgi:hypothetical protein
MLGNPSNPQIGSLFAMSKPVIIFVVAELVMEIMIELEIVETIHYVSDVAKETRTVMDGVL